jgi:PAS domain S-box-containing protein
MAGNVREKGPQKLATLEATLSIEDRYKELAEVQRIAKVGGVLVELREGFKNRRSPEYLAIHGLPPEAANEAHEDWVRRIHPEDRERAEQQFLTTLESSADRYSSEYRIIRPDNGEIRWIGAEGRIERDEAGRALRLIGAHIDITDRVAARELLRESEERFRLIADSAPVPMWVTRLDRTRAFANQAYVDFIGVPYEEALLFDWRQILHPEDQPRVVQESLAGEASLKPFVLEGRYRRADGTWRWIRSESQPRWDMNGGHVGFIGVAHDVTLAKEAEVELRQLNETLEYRIAERTAQLRSSQAQLQTILETTNLYHMLLELDGQLVYANAQALSGIGAGPKDVFGRPFWQTMWFSHSQSARDPIIQCFSRAKQGQAARCEVELELPQGKRNIDFVLRPVFGQGTQITGVLAEGVDTTDRRRNEEALRQAQKMEAVGQLTGGVAHDFNNLLTIIRSATDFLRRRDLPPDRRNRYIDAISDTADRAAKLTSQLLAFARRQPLKPEVFDIGAQVANISNLLRPLVGGRVQINLDARSGELFALADVSQFETALVNLAINGRDAMKGEGQLRISAASKSNIPPMRGQPERIGDFIAVVVADHGVGVSAENLDQIFEPFFTTKEVGKGTGLGLSQAFGFAKQSGGDLGVESTLGRGATFTIYLPRAESPPAENGLSNRVYDTANGRGYRILVVEDNLEVGRFSTELLRDLGYSIQWVNSAEEALSVLEKDEFAFDLVFSDVVMPGTNGLDLARTIRIRFPGLPVVLTSGYSDVLAAESHGGFTLIQKPYSVEVLSRTVRRVLLNAPRA